MFLFFRNHVLDYLCVKCQGFEISWQRRSHVALRKMEKRNIIVDGRSWHHEYLYTVSQLVYYMPEVMIDLPEDLARELEQISKLDLSLVVSKLLKERLTKLARLKRIVSKSKLSEKKRGKLLTKSIFLYLKNTIVVQEKFEKISVCIKTFFLPYRDMPGGF